MKMTAKLMAGVASAAVVLTAALPAMAADKWDMPMAYSASNFHSDNGAEFAGGANQTTITSCADEASARGLEASKAYTHFTMNGLAAGGMTVGPAGDDLMSGLRAVGETITAEWFDEGKAIVDAFNA